MKTLAILSMLAVTPAALAWGETGHMVVAQIAYEQLDPAVRAEADRLLLVGKTDRAYDFVTTGPWADDIRRERPETGQWHYKDLFFRQDGKPVLNHAEEPNAVTQIRLFTAVLHDRSQSDAERADALRYLIHFVGDIHQPLHATARETDKLPKGDRGGNDFKIVPPTWMGERGPTNLHSLWDGGVGLFDRVNRPLDGTGRSAVKMVAQVSKLVSLRSVWVVKSTTPIPITGRRKARTSRRSLSTRPPRTARRMRDTSKKASRSSQSASRWRDIAWLSF